MVKLLKWDFSPVLPGFNVTLLVESVLVGQVGFRTNISVLSGFNVTVLAYGQTGSGKTHTMGTAYR